MSQNYFVNVKRYKMPQHFLYFVLVFVIWENIVRQSQFYKDNKILIDHSIGKLPPGKTVDNGHKIILWLRHIIEIIDCCYYYLMNVLLLNIVKKQEMLLIPVHNITVIGSNTYKIF